MTEISSTASGDVQREHMLGLGMFVFLASEAMLFAGLFMLYVAGRIAHPTAFAHGVGSNLGWVGASNTYLLLTSSWSIAISVNLAYKGKNKSSFGFVIFTILAGITFLILKAYEYCEHVAAGEGPLALANGEDTGVTLFRTLYWLITGTHALHVLAGLVWLSVVGWWQFRGQAQPFLNEMAAWYWHLVDVMWIFIWPMFYLLGRASA